MKDEILVVVKVINSINTEVTKELSAQLYNSNHVCPATHTVVSMAFLVSFRKLQTRQLRESWSS